MCANTGPEYPPKGRFEDEITIEELVHSLASLIIWIRRHLIGLAFFLFAGVGVSIFWVSLQPVSYAAELTFMLNDENNPQVSGISGVLGQLGLPITGGKYNVDKLLEIAKSRNLMQSTLLKKARIDGTSDWLANHFIHLLELDSRWTFREESLVGFSFGEEGRVQSEEELFVMKLLVDLIAGPKSDRSGALFSTDYGRTDYIMSFMVKTPSEQLSIAFIDELYNQVSAFYINQATQKNTEVLHLIEAKRDSLNELINAKAFSVATLRDKSNETFRNTNRVEINLLEADLLGLRSAVEEVARNLERAGFVLETSTPLIQILDRPMAPLSPQKPGILKYSVGGGLAGCLLYLCLLFALKVFRISKKKS